MPAALTDRLLDRIALITGGARGQGAAHAHRLAAEGAAVLVNDLGSAVDGSGSDNGPAGQVVAEITEAGGKAAAPAAGGKAAAPAAGAKPAAAPAKK